jgi:hypothetical protein
MTSILHRGGLRTRIVGYADHKIPLQTIIAIGSLR